MNEVHGVVVPMQFVYIFFGFILTSIVSFVVWIIKLSKKYDEDIIVLQKDIKELLDRINEMKQQEDNFRRGCQSDQNKLGELEKRVVMQDKDIGNLVNHINQLREEVKQLHEAIHENTLQIQSIVVYIDEMKKTTTTNKNRRKRNDNL